MNEIAAILISFERHSDWQSKEVKIRISDENKVFGEVLDSRGTSSNKTVTCRTLGPGRTPNLKNHLWKVVLINWDDTRTGDESSWLHTSMPPSPFHTPSPQHRPAPRATSRRKS
ncbi:hypothetical protein J6590_003639 [Homalodisca vitripennis]|nr:hypothetical protein J6590_003639 [Homalodisca vitripennis]